MSHPVRLTAGVPVAGCMHGARSRAIVAPAGPTEERPGPRRRADNTGKEEEGILERVCMCMCMCVCVYVNMCVCVCL